MQRSIRMGLWQPRRIRNGVYVRFTQAYLVAVFPCRCLLEPRGCGDLLRLSVAVEIAPGRAGNELDEAADGRFDVFRGVPHSSIMKRHNSLELDETVQKLLISTTSWLVGQYDVKGIAINHAWLNMFNANEYLRMQESPISRCGFVLVFRTPRLDKEPGVVIPDYSSTGERICAYMSILYGKKFDCHGLLEGTGLYHIPNLSQWASVHNPSLPFNSHSERKCFPMPLELDGFSKIRKAIDADSEQQQIAGKMDAVCRHYMQALQSVEYNPEVAYLNLITAGEILSGCFDYSKEELLDDHTRKDLQVIAKTAADGEEIERRLLNRFTWIRRRFVLSLNRLLDEEFFSSSECEMGFGQFKPDDMEERIAAAYDLRSTYVHTGVRFGDWTRLGRHNEDVQLGQPVVEDKKLGRILYRAPTFAGLERLIRYCSLRYMQGIGLLALSDT